MLKSFSVRKIDFQEASNVHVCISEILNVYSRIPDKKSQFKHFDAVQEIWDQLVGILPNDKKTEIAHSIEFTIPTEFIPIMYTSDCVPAVFALQCIIAECMKSKVDFCNLDDLVFREALRRAWKAFDLRRLQANNIEEGFGQDHSASWHTLRDIVDSHRSRNIEKQMIEIAKLAGKMFDSFGYTKKKVKSDDPQAISTTKVGGEIDRLLPSEMVKLDTPELSDQTIMKVLQKNAQQFKMTGHRTKTRGPLVLAIDESGSMHDKYYGYRGRNTWAKACAVALTRIAWSENRPVRCVHFGSSSVNQHLDIGDQSALFELARSFMSGGTCFDVAFRSAHDLVGDLEKEGYKGADIVLITDGEESDWDQHDMRIDRLDNDGIDLWTIAIECNIKEQAPVRKRAKKYIHVSYDNMHMNLEKSIDDGLIEGLDKAALSKMN